MKKCRFAETQIVSILKQSNTSVPVKDICRQAGSACRLTCSQ